MHVHFERKLRNPKWALTDLVHNLRSVTPKFDATIDLRYGRAKLNVVWSMNGKLVTLRISDTNACSSFNSYHSVDEILNISKKPVSSSQTSGECHKFHDETSPARLLDPTKACPLADSWGHMNER